MPLFAARRPDLMVETARWNPRCVQANFRRLLRRETVVALPSGARHGVTLGTEIPAAAHRRNSAPASALARQIRVGSFPSFRQDLRAKSVLIEGNRLGCGFGKNYPPHLRGPSAPGEADAVYDFRNEPASSTLVAQDCSEGSHQRAHFRGHALAGTAGRAAGIARFGADQAFLRTQSSACSSRRSGPQYPSGRQTHRLVRSGPHLPRRGRGGGQHARLVLTARPPPIGAVAKNPRARLARCQGPCRSPARSSLRSFQDRSEISARLGADILIGGKSVGRLAQLAPSSARELDATTGVLVAEFDLKALHGASARQRIFRHSKIPAITRDIAIVCPLAMTYGEIEDTLRAGERTAAGAHRTVRYFYRRNRGETSRRSEIGRDLLDFPGHRADAQQQEVNAAGERLKQSLKAKLAVDFRE